MTRRLAFATLLASALSACQLGGDTSRSPCRLRAGDPRSRRLREGRGLLLLRLRERRLRPEPDRGRRVPHDGGLRQPDRPAHRRLAHDALQGPARARRTSSACSATTATSATTRTTAAATRNASRGTAPAAPAPRMASANRTTRPSSISPRSSSCRTGSRRSSRRSTVSDPDGGLAARLRLDARAAAPRGRTRDRSLLSSQTVQAPTFTSSVIGDYVLKLIVTDGSPPRPNRLSASDTMMVRVRNLEPVVTALANQSHASRHVLQTPSASVSDPTATRSPARGTRARLPVRRSTARRRRAPARSRGAARSAPASRPSRRAPGPSRSTSATGPTRRTRPRPTSA